ncbi:hypothetical protein ACQ4LE_009767 [Meloidogyne hapla]|uniref:HMG box domain-containing protein n=1 Tax=Meloidogyne hapla TaxID=6305 RepID=A0A1I8BC34_MELHA
MYRSTPHRNQDSVLRPPRMPDRPLVPYMRYSKKVWQEVRAENPDSPLWDFGRIIGQLWNNLPPAEKLVYQQEYEVEKAEYEKAVKNYNAAYAQYMASKSRIKGSQQDKGSSGNINSNRKLMPEANALSGVFIQPVDDEDPLEMAGKRMAAIRYDRNNRLMAELFSPSYMPDPRTFVPQQKIEHFRKQGQSLEQHQNKLNDELTKLEEIFNQRKNAIEEVSEVHSENMKRLCQDKSRLDQERYDKIAEEYGENLLTSWKLFEQKQAAIQAKLDADKRANPILNDLIISKTPPSQPTNEEKTDNEREEEVNEQAITNNYNNIDNNEANDESKMES